MGKRNFSIGKYLCLGWLAIYLLISIFKFIQINYKINVKYGIAAKKFMVIGYTNESVVIDNILLFLNKTIFPHFNPLYEYAVPNKMSSTIKLRVPFMDKSFNIIMRGGEIVKDTFYETITIDPKFQHLYSEWVKKQVGIEDEEVELYLNYDGIDFNKIKTLNETYDEIFENCHYTLRRINISDVDSKGKYSIFNNFRNKYYDKINKDKDNRFEIEFNNESYIGIVDYIKIGKKDYYLQKIGINNNKTIQVLGKYEQLDEIFNNANSINELIEKIIPNKFYESNVLTKVVNDKAYAGSVLRLDLSDMIRGQYIVDVIYYDMPKIQYDNIRLAVLNNPKYMRYNIILKDDKFSIVSYNEIHHSEYLGDKYRERTYKINKKKDRITIYNVNKGEYEDIEFNNIELVGQPDDEKINEIISKKFKNILKEYIEENINNQKVIKKKINKAGLISISLQTDDYIVLKSSILENYLVLDLNEYKFIDYKVTAENENYKTIEIDGKLFSIR